jgi:hypothetical protein
MFLLKAEEHDMLIFCHSNRVQHLMATSTVAFDTLSIILIPILNWTRESCFARSSFLFVRDIGVFKITISTSQSLNHAFQSQGRRFKENKSNLWKTLSHGSVRLLMMLQSQVVKEGQQSEFLLWDARR